MFNVENQNKGLDIPMSPRTLNPDGNPPSNATVVCLINWCTICNIVHHRKDICKI